MITKERFVIAVTGTPGTGKSTFAKMLSKEMDGSRIMELNEIVDEYRLFSRIDKMGSKVVKLKELEKKTKELIAAESSTAIIVGHLVPEIRIGQQITVVTRVGLKELIGRLEARNYQFEKVKENLISESIDYCGVKCREEGLETYEVETESEKSEIISYIKDFVAGKRHKQPEMKEISMFNELMEIATSDNRYGL